MSKPSKVSDVEFLRAVRWVREKNAGLIGPTVGDIARETDFSPTSRNPVHTRIHALLEEGLLGAIFENGRLITRSLYVTKAGLALLEEHSDNGG